MAATAANETTTLGRVIDMVSQNLAVLFGFVSSLCLNVLIESTKMRGPSASVAVILVLSLVLWVNVANVLDRYAQSIEHSNPLWARIWFGFTNFVTSTVVLFITAQYLLLLFRDQWDSGILNSGETLVIVVVVVFVLFAVLEVFREWDRLRRKFSSLT